MKLITWNSAQTWVTKIVKNLGLVCRQPTICLPRKTWEQILRHRLVYWDDYGVIWILHAT